MAGSNSSKGEFSPLYHLVVELYETSKENPRVSELVKEALDEVLTLTYSLSGFTISLNSHQIHKVPSNLILHYLNSTNDLLRALHEVSGLTRESV